MNKISAQNLVKIYNKRAVVNKNSLFLEKGEIVGLLGPNGAGKTTTFRLIVGLIHPDSGTIEADSKDITQLPMYKRARIGLGYLAQEASIFRKMTVNENLMAILQTTKLDKKEQKEKCDTILEDLKITHIRENNASTLSGGERRRTEIARALCTEPDFLLLDEPFAGVDPIAVEDIQSIISALRKKKGLGILITDHNVRDTLRITDRAYIMYEGQIIKDGTSEFLANDPEARKLYLGQNFTLN